LLARADQYVTSCEDIGRLDPWITWSSLHRGVGNSAHGIAHLGQSTKSIDLLYPPVWQLLREARLDTAVFGSLFSSEGSQDASSYAFYLPDYFALREDGFPDSLKAFHRLNLVMTRESSLNVSRRVPISAVKSFAKEFHRWGISAATLRDLAGQILLELRDPKKKTRRRSYQTSMMFDVYFRHLAELRPAFSTFYTNHVAAAMHRFWGATFPEDYNDHPFGSPWIGDFREEIDFAMTVADRALGRLRRFVDDHPEYLLMIASSMGQAAIPAERTYGLYTITDLQKFTRHLGLEPGEWKEHPSMVPCRSFKVAHSKRPQVRRTLQSMRLDEWAMKSVRGYAGPFGFDEREDGYFHVHVEFKNYAGAGRLTVASKDLPADMAGVGSMACDHEVSNTAQHIPEGSLIIYGAREASRCGRGRCSTLDIAPTILAQFGIERPRYMDGSVL
jgi:hypothetical protein